MASNLRMRHMALRVEAIFYILESQWKLRPLSTPMQVQSDIADRKMQWRNKAPQHLEKLAKKEFTEDSFILLREAHQLLSLLHSCSLTVHDEAFLRLIQIYHLDSSLTTSISMWAYLRANSTDTIRRHVHFRSQWLGRSKEWVEQLLMPILLRLRDDHYAEFRRPQTKDLCIQYGSLDELGRRRLQQQMSQRLGRAILQDYGYIFGEIVALPTPPSETD